MIGLPFIVMVTLILLNVPIAFALIGSGILGIWLMTGSWSVVISMLGTTAASVVSQYILSTVPMFILMAFFSSSSGLAEDLYTCGSRWTSNIRGGLAIATVFACGIFGAMSGASVAAAAVMSKIAMPNMRRLGYSEPLAAGSIGIGATLDILIPPSVAMVIYGIATETSISKLLIAGVIPGIVVGIILILCILVWVTIRPQDAPQTQSVTWAERWQSLLRIWPSILLIILVLAILYTGIATPTEAGGLGAFTAAVIGITMGRLTWAGVLDSLKSTVRVSTMIFTIFIGACLFGQFVVLSKMPQILLAHVIERNFNPYLIITGIIVGYFLISMFMDEVPLLLITLPLTFPLITSLGFDPVWFGVLSILMMCMGLVFPPVGLVAFVVAATANVALQDVFKGTSVFMIALVIATILIIIFPQIALWLPSTM